MNPSIPIGIVVVDKPEGVTSHDVVRKMRKTFRTPRVGHLGTLDPMATGVLPLTLGPATRLARFVPNSPKEYVGTIRFGWETTTLDREGDPVGKPEPADLEPVQLVEAMESFLGTSHQIPPAFSAKKIGGRRAYRMAREGEPVEPAPIEVTIDRFTPEAIRTESIDFRVVCSGGTYIRSLARDLGRRLGTSAHLSRLRRTRSGPFLEVQAVGIENAEPGDVIRPSEFLGHLPGIEVEGDAAEAVGHGQSVPCGGDEGYLCIFNKERDLLAVAWRKDGWAHPEVVLI